MVSQDGFGVSYNWVGKCTYNLTIYPLNISRAVNGCCPRLLERTIRSVLGDQDTYCYALLFGHFNIKRWALFLLPSLDGIAVINPLDALERPFGVEHVA